MTAPLAHAVPANMRTLPHSLEAERAVIGCVLVRATSLEEAPDLRVDDFFLPAHREIFEAIRALVSRLAPIDILGLADELKVRGMLARLEGGAQYLNECVNDCPTTDSMAHYAKIVMERATLRRLIMTCGEIASSAYGDFGSVKDFLTEARRKLAAIELPDHDDQPKRIGDGMRTILDSIEHRAENPGAYLITTGFRTFDAKIGGLRGGNLVIVAARPGKGKSAWALQVLLDNAFRKVPALLFSMEMSASEITERAIAQQSEVNGQRIAVGDMKVPEWLRVNAAAGRIAEVPFWLYTKTQTADRICSMIRRWFAKLPTPEGMPKQAIVGIDYLGLVSSLDDGDRRDQQLGAMTRAFKACAAELDIPFVVLAQLNRDSEKDDRKPKLRDLRDSGHIEQDANTVIFPWWEGKAPFEGLHPAQLIVEKNRGGRTGHIELDWQGEYVRFVDHATSDQPEQSRLSYADD